VEVDARAELGVSAGHGCGLEGVDTKSGRLIESGGGWVE
jgi:hypothetical protein